jgi:hypothetical protein
MSEAQETYRPTEEEKRRGKWAVVAQCFDEDEDPDWSSPVHIIPTMGAVHEISKSCWCSPKTEHADNGETLVHQVSQ